MNSSHAFTERPEGWRLRPALRRSYLRADRPKALAEALKLAGEEDEREALDRDDAIDPSKPHAELERRTRTFRWLLSRRYAQRATAARARARAVADAWARAQTVPGFPIDEATAVEEERAALASARWYAGRSSAQPARFATVRACKTRMLKVKCRIDATTLCDPIPCRCGVIRVCDSCAEHKAAERQKKLSAARVVLLQRAHEKGLDMRQRAGGAFREKMLTLTTPHFSRSEATGLVAERCAAFGIDTTVNARLIAIHLAWPRFVRRIRAWLGGRGPRWERRHPGCSPDDAKSLAYYRAFEWTRGSDGQGHPHFHVYLFAPWLDVELLRKWWAACLEAVGAPPSGRVVVDLQALDGFSWATLKELIKSGDRRAIEMRLGEWTSGGRAIKYSSGWTMGKAFDELAENADVDVQRDLYCALEGRRMAQGSRGLLLPPVRPICACCGQSMFAASVADPCEVHMVNPDAAAPVHVGAGPPERCEAPW